MAVDNFDSWIPVEYDSDVIMRMQQESAVIALGQETTMGSNERSIPRSGGVDFEGLAKGGAYTLDTSTINDSVLLFAQKYGVAVPVAEEDLQDSLANIVNSKTIDMATSFAKLYDNHCMGVTAAKGVATMADGSHPVFDSLYYLLASTNESATGYTSGSNITTSTSAGLTWPLISAWLGQVEDSDYFDPNDMVVIASPAIKASLRGILDSQNRPIFNESTAGMAGGGQGGPTIQIAGYRAHWSRGCRLSANPSPKPSGHPFMVAASASYLNYGTRRPLSIQPIDGNTGLGALTDTFYLKGMSRRAFAPGALPAFSILVDASK